jgi:hypothetical protein
MYPFYISMYVQILLTFSFYSLGCLFLMIFICFDIFLYISYILIYKSTNSHNKNILSFRYRKKTHSTHPLTIRSRTFPTVTPHCFPVRSKCHLVLKRATKIKTRTFELSQSISLSPSKFVIIFSYLKL